MIFNNIECVCLDSKFLFVIIIIMFLSFIVGILAEKYRGKFLK